MGAVERCTRGFGGGKRGLCYRLRRSVDEDAILYQFLLQGRQKLNMAHLQPLGRSSDQLLSGWTSHLELRRSCIRWLEAPAYPNLVEYPKIDHGPTTKSRASRRLLARAFQCVIGSRIYRNDYAPLDLTIISWLFLCLYNGSSTNHSYGWQLGSNLWLHRYSKCSFSAFKRPC